MRLSNCTALRSEDILCKKTKVSLRLVNCRSLPPSPQCVHAEIPYHANNCGDSHRYIGVYSQKASKWYIPGVEKGGITQTYQVELQTTKQCSLCRAYSSVSKSPDVVQDEIRQYRNLNA